MFFDLSLLFQIIGGVVFALLVLFAITALTGAPYVPSLKFEINEAFTKLYKISEKDLIVDLGSGDGVVLKIANDFGAKGFGVEINPILVLATKFRFRKNKDIAIKSGNLFTMDFPKETTVVYVFGDSRDIEKIAQAIKKQAEKIGHPLYLISNAFQLKSIKPIKQHRAYFLYKISNK